MVLWLCGDHPRWPTFSSHRQRQLLTPESLLYFLYNYQASAILKLRQTIHPDFKDVNSPERRSWQNGADKCRRRGIPWKRCPQKRSDKSWHSKTFRVLFLHVLCESYINVQRTETSRETGSTSTAGVRDWDRLWCSMGHSGSALRISALSGVLCYHKIMLWLFF